MNKPTLYGPLTRALIVLQQLEESGGELTPELEEAFALTTENVAERAERLVEYRINCEMLIAESKRRIEREQAAIKMQERAIALLDKSLKSGVELMGPLQAGTYKLTLRKSAAVIVTDAAQIPDEYRKPVIIPPTPEKGEPDKAAIKKAIDAGAFVAGAYVENRTNLQVK